MACCFDTGIDERVCPCTWCVRLPAVPLQRRFNAGERSTDAAPFMPLNLSTHDGGNTATPQEVHRGR